MAYYVKELNDWAVRRIEERAREDVDLLIGHSQWNVPEDGNEIRFTYFLYNSKKGKEIATTFVLEGIGCDYWGMPWERIEHIATLEENLNTILLDGVILWARNEEVKAKFEALQHLAESRLANVGYRYGIALQKLEAAMEVYKVMLFDSSLSHVRKGLSYIANMMSEALAANMGIYFKRGPEEQDKVLDLLPETPEGYTDAYRQVVHMVSIEDCRKLAYEMLSIVRAYLMEKKPPYGEQERNYNYQDMASWYEEGTYVFRRLYTYTQNGDAAKTLQWGYTLQAELDFASEEYGLKEMNLLDAYQLENLMILNQRGHEIQEYLRNTILENGVKIREFASLQELFDSGI